MWWPVIVSGLLIAVLISGLSAGVARTFGPEPTKEPDRCSDDAGDELERDAWDDHA